MEKWRDILEIQHSKRSLFYNMLGFDKKGNPCEPSSIITEAFEA